MRFEVDSNNAVNIFNDGDTVPFLFQPTYPNGDKFDSNTEASVWGALKVLAFDPAQLDAPIGKGLPATPKVVSPDPEIAIAAEAAAKTAQQAALADANTKMEALGFTQANINALLAARTPLV